MHARVAKFSVADAEAQERAINEIRERAESGPPEGVPATGFLMLTDKDNGVTYAIGFFENEEDMRTGDAALSAMDPPADMGSRADVNLCEVAIKIEAPQGEAA